MFNRQRLYVWQGLDHDQQLSNGELVARSRLEAKKMLLLQGMVPMSISGREWLSDRKYYLPGLMVITRQLATMLSAGLPLTHCLKLIAVEHPRPIWRYLLNSINQQVSQGYLLSQALDQHPLVFPIIFRELIKIGEASGQLDLCCQQLADQQEKLSQLRKKIKKSLTYPVTVVSMAITVTLLMLIFVLPEFTEIYQTFNASLPVFTQWVINLSDFICFYGGYLIIFLLLIGAGYRKQRKIKPHWLLLEQQWLFKIPFCGQLLRLGCLSRMMRTLAMTQHAGIPLLNGLKMAANAVGNPLYQQAILRVAVQVEQGTSFYYTLYNHSLFPSLSYQLIRVGEESGSLEIMLEKLAIIYEQEVNHTIEGLTQKIEPLLMAILGFIVGGLVIAMYLPIFQLGNVISG